MPAVSIEHYENFPVASWLCPPALRPAIAAIYHFARTADDIADEGEASADQRLAELRAYRLDLQAVSRGQPASPRWAAHVFSPLGPVLQRHRLPLSLLEALLDAFEQDLVKTRYADRAELIDYCRRSADPVGRLLLHLYGVADAQALRQSDAICSSLQLINFWQDMSRDGPRGRVYAPQQDLSRHGLSAEALQRCEDSPAARALLRDLCDWAERLMHEGAPLVHRLPGRAGWELRLVVQGGLRILAKIKAMDHATLLTRPRLHAIDLPPMLWRALRMHAGKNPRAEAK
ncbi:squalene synthase HpnC [Paucibacter sp. PLA-PC-4]|uniref:squalene synthase HpnC n=1 Tax=Paucibacter sp. PLA-PC-4 TaxID=2993655 RepID=UPI00224924FB|nr:squalene synthase HpnC [Paucibacter sp. PLA-PC-4]MCX2862619.1 squalene synthase HpnC [Paucibacter sp. PLA-PC-4]